MSTQQTTAHSFRDLRTTHPGYAALTAAAEIPGLPRLEVFAGRIEITAPLSPQMAQMMPGAGAHYEQHRAIWCFDLERWQDVVAVLPAIAEANIARGDEEEPDRICLYVLDTDTAPQIGDVFRWRSLVRGREYRVAEWGPSMTLPVTPRSAGLDGPKNTLVRWYYADALDAKGA